jgi:hypothetical protein
MNFLIVSSVGQNKKPRTQLSFVDLIVSFDRPHMSSSHSKSFGVLNNESRPIPRVMIFHENCSAWLSPLMV